MVTVVVGVVAALLVWLFLQSPTQADRPSGSPVVGRPAPAITATDTTGAEFRLDAYRNAWVLVNFFATWCPPCVQEHPELVRFEQGHAGSKDAFLVSVSFNDDPAAVRSFFERNGGTWPVIAEGNARIALDYGVVKLPESYLIAPNGLVVAKFDGGVRAADVDAAIARAEQGS